MSAHPHPDPEWLARLDLVGRQYDDTLSRIRDARDRIGHATGWRSAALAEVRAAVQDYRESKAVLGIPAREQGWQITLADAADLVGVSRRTLTDAGDVISDRVLATDALNYRDQSDHANRQLHERHPHLYGLLEAAAAVAKAHMDVHEPDGPEDLWPDNDQVPWPPPGYNTIMKTYWGHIRRLAETGAPVRVGDEIHTPHGPATVTRVHAAHPETVDVHHSGHTGEPHHPCTCGCPSDSYQLAEVRRALVGAPR